MKNTLQNLKLCSTLLVLLALGLTQVKAQVSLNFLGRYSTGIYNNAAAEITAYDPITKRLFITNGPDTSLKIVNISNPTNPTLVTSLSIKPYGIDLTSVTCKNGIVAIAVIDSNGKTNPSNIVFLDANGTFLNKVKAGPNADMITFTPDGRKVLVANEGEPNVGYTIDPEGSVSIIDISGGIANLNQSHVSTATFTAFNNITLDKSIRVFGRIQTSGGAFLRNSTVAEDMEPEYLAVSDDSKTVWATCQENNCIAEISVDSAYIRKLIPLGFKNHSLPGNGLDASDNGTTINIANYPVFGLYDPDAIAYSRLNNTNYLFTANEGDARADWGAANVEEVRFGSSSFIVDTVKFGGTAAVTALKANTALGRLTVSNRFGDFNNDGKMDSAFCFGGRSFSIWDANTGLLVWDSKDELEQIIKNRLPANFNSSHTANTLKNRSDDKGPEPEAITIGKIGDSTYAFIGLERVGGIMVFNVSNPASPYFVDYINTRNFSVTPGSGTLATVGDLGPEGLVFVPASQSPNGKNMIILSNEISGTVSLFEIKSKSDFQLQVLHASDMESGIDAVIDAPNFAAVLDKLEDEHTSTLKLASGDCYIPGPFLAAGEDASVQPHLRSTASSYFPGTTSGLRAAIGRVDIAMMNIMGFQGSALGNHEFDLGTAEVNSIIGVDIRSNGNDKRWIGAQFPYLSANLDFTNDINLSYLYTNQRLHTDSFKTKANITANAQKKGIAPSAIAMVNGQKIGLVGATTQLLANISSPGATIVKGGNSDNMVALAAVLQPVIDSLRFTEGINKIIVMSHLQQLANEEALAPLLKGVDIIIAGGSHSLLADSNDRLRTGHTAVRTYPIMKTNFDGEPLAILNTSAEWKYIGRFVVDFDSTGVIIPSMLNSVINGAYAADSAMVTSLYGNYATAFTAGTKGALVRTLTSAIGNVINNKDGNKFGKTSVFLEGRRNAVRTEESNLGNLSSDANLWAARRVDPTVKISIKNGGGIRSAIGEVYAAGSLVELRPTAANPGANKLSGDISQLDIENSLRFNNKLSILSVNGAGLRRIVEHGISATTPGATPGQFPQVGGIQFSYDTTLARGSRIRSLVVLDSLGVRTDTVVRNGQLYGDTSKVFKLVTLDFLAGGGDNYPFPANGFNRINLDTALKDSMYARFQANGTEQDAFADFMYAKHNTTAYAVRDTNLLGDTRIQLLNTRRDGIFPETNPAISIAAARAISAPTMVRIRGVVTRAYGRFIYIQDATAGIGVRQSSGDMVNAITNNLLQEGDSVEVLGPRNDFNNYAQIQLASGVYTSTNTVIKLGTTSVPAPIELTLKQINQQGEMYESRLVKVVGLNSIQKGTFAASSNVTVYDGSTAGDTTILRILASADTEIDDAPALKIPNGDFVFEGILAQFCSSPAANCATGYQLYAVRKKDITPSVIQLGMFNLLNPADNAVLTTKSNNSTNVVIDWNNSNKAISYKWMLDVPTGNFTAPVLTIPAMAKDTFISLRNSQIDTVLAGLGLKAGDSIATKWTVYAYSANNDSLKSSNTFNLTLKRAPVLTPFALVSPLSNSRVVVKEGAADIIQAKWNKSQAAIGYKWKATTLNGTFTNSLLSVASDKAGTDTVLTLNSGLVDGILAGLGIQKGDSVELKWTVYALENATDSLEASNVFNIKLVRANPLNAFNLLSPSNGARLVVKEGDNTPVNITWEASNNVATYKWIASTNTSLNPELLRINANNNGKATTLTLTSNAIDAVLAANGIAKGDSLELKWTIRAYDATDSLQANQVFGVKIIRDRATGIDVVNADNNWIIYPVPTSTILNISNKNNVSFVAEIMSMDGKSLKKSNISSIDVSDLSSGMYILMIHSEGQSKSFRFTKD